MAAEETGKLDLKANVCVICQISLADSPILQLTCSHFLHDDCAQECAMHQQTTCPICRQESPKLVQYAKLLARRQSNSQGSGRRAARRQPDVVLNAPAASNRISPAIPLRRSLRLQQNASNTNSTASPHPPSLHFPLFNNSVTQSTTRPRNRDSILAGRIGAPPNPQWMTEESVDETMGPPLFQAANLTAPSAPINSPPTPQITMQLEPELKQVSTKAGGMHFMLSLAVPDPPINSSTHYYRAPVDLIFVLDRSGSMADTTAAADCLSLAELCERVVSHGLLQLTPQDRISIITFDNLVYRTCGLRQCTDEFKRQIVSGLRDSLSPGGSTAIHKALEEAFEVAFKRRQQHRQCHILLVTDGRNDTPVQMQQLAEQQWWRVSPAFGVYLAKPHGTLVERGADDLTNCQAVPNIHCFGLGASHDIPCLQSISNYTGGIYQPVLNAQLIGEAFGVVYGRILALATAGPMKLDVRISDSSALLTTKLVRFRGDLVFQQLRDGGLQLDCLLPPMAYGQKKSLIISANLADESTSARPSQLVLECRLSTAAVLVGHPQSTPIQSTVSCSVEREPDRTVFAFDPQVVLQYLRLLKAEMICSLMSRSVHAQQQHSTELFAQLRSSILVHPAYQQKPQLFHGLLQELEEDERGLQQGSSQSMAIVAGNQTRHNRQTATVFVGSTVPSAYMPSRFQSVAMDAFTRSTAS